MKLTKVATIGTLAISLAGLTACNNMMAAEEAPMSQPAPTAQSQPAAQANMTKSNVNVVQIAQSNPDFSLLVEAVQAANLAGILSEPSANYTIFAPTNEAFAKVLQDTGMTKEQLFADKALLTKILGYHVINANMPVYAKDVKPGNVVMLSTDTLVVTPQGTLMDENGRTANILQTDLAATNGVVHVIDTVLLPK
ncbi:fasciclin domain-containing protein [uncultured Psychrobacter sp.]|uniref:fasciclin domain-containing protein n=1 Tax=uncultured Psychrobacter sp. TaxID=259303 RepID=UPI00345992A1